MAEDQQNVNEVDVSASPPLTKRQKIIFCGIAASYVFNLMSFSIIAPFFPAEVCQHYSLTIWYIFIEIFLWLGDSYRSNQGWNCNRSEVFCCFTFSLWQYLPVLLLLLHYYCLLPAWLSRSAAIGLQKTAIECHLLTCNEWEDGNLSRKWWFKRLELHLNNVKIYKTVKCAASSLIINLKLSALQY